MDAEYKAKFESEQPVTDEELFVEALEELEKDPEKYSNFVQQEKEWF